MPNTTTPMVSNRTNLVFSFEDLDFIEVQEAKKIKNEGGDVNVAFIFGEESYGIVTIGNGGIQMIHKELGSAGTADPINQQETLAYKIDSFGAAVIRGEAIYALHYPSNKIAETASPTGGYRGSDGA